MPNVSKPVSSVNDAVLRTPGGLALALDQKLVEGALTQDDFSEVLDTLQVLTDQLHHHSMDLSDLRSTLFALTLLVQGGRKTESKELLQKIAGVLEVIPEPVFRSAADYVIQSRAWKFSPPPNVTAMVAKALAARSKIIHQEVVPTILRLTAQAASEDRAQSFNAAQSLDRIGVALGEVYDQATLPEEKRAVLQQYSYFVILTSGLIPTNAIVDLLRLPRVSLGTSPELAIAVSGPDFILLSDQVVARFSKERVFDIIRHESFHVLQRIEGLRGPQVNRWFREFAGELLSRLVASQKLEHPLGSTSVERSRWLRNLFESYQSVLSEWETAVFVFRKSLEPLKQSTEFRKEAARLDLEMTGPHTLVEQTDEVKRDLEEIFRKITQDPKLGKAVAERIRILGQRAVQTSRAFVAYPIEAMAETPFDYGRAGEILDRFFGRRKE